MQHANKARGSNQAALTTGDRGAPRPFHGSNRPPEQLLTHHRRSEGTRTFIKGPLTAGISCVVQTSGRLTREQTWMLSKMTPDPPRPFTPPSAGAELHFTPSVQNHSNLQHLRRKERKQPAGSSVGSPAPRLQIHSSPASPSDLLRMGYKQLLAVNNKDLRRSTGQRRSPTLPLIPDLINPGRFPGMASWAPAHSLAPTFSPPVAAATQVVG